MPVRLRNSSLTVPFCNFESFAVFPDDQYVVECKEPPLIPFDLITNVGNAFRFPRVRISAFVGSDTPAPQHPRKSRHPRPADRQMFRRFLQPLHSQRISRLRRLADGQRQGVGGARGQQGLSTQRHHRRALSIRVDVVDATWKLSCIVLHHDSLRK